MTATSEATMRAAVLHGPGDVRVEQVARSHILRPDDAVVQVVASCVCGSDLHPYRSGLGDRGPKRAGHEFVGTVTEVGTEVRSLQVGDFVIAPFAISDGTCVRCRQGVTTSCEHGSFWGGPDRFGNPNDGGQGEYARVPLADGTLVVVPGPVDDALIPHLLTLSDVMGTGHHAAVSAAVGAGSTVVVVGDGAVGLCGVLAARRLGAAQVIAMSRHPERQRIARAFGATEVLEGRGGQGVAAVQELLPGGADSVLECVGTQESMDQAVGSARPGGHVGFVGAPSGALPTGQLFGRNLHYAGGVAPVRHYLPELLVDVLNGTLRPGAVFDATMTLDETPAAYAAMEGRTATKVLLRP